MSLSKSAATPVADGGGLALTRLRATHPYVRGQVMPRHDVWSVLSQSGGRLARSLAEEDGENPDGCPAADCGQTVAPAFGEASAPRMWRLPIPPL